MKNGNHDNIIQCHHIENYKKNNNNNNINLVTLCLKCHSREDGHYLKLHKKEE